MGMIEEKDIILAISWSGETTELGNIVKYALENKIKLIYFEHHYDDMIIKDYKFWNINKLLKDRGFSMIKKSKMLFRKSFEYVYENQK